MKETMEKVQSNLTNETLKDLEEKHEKEIIELKAKYCDYYEQIEALKEQPLYKENQKLKEQNAFLEKERGEIIKQLELDEKLVSLDLEIPDVDYILSEDDDGEIVVKVRYEKANGLYCSIDTIVSELLNHTLSDYTSEEAYKLNTVAKGLKAVADTLVNETDKLAEDIETVESRIREIKNLNDSSKLTAIREEMRLDKEKEEKIKHLEKMVKLLGRQISKNP
jgi:hypothetical protein